MKIRCVPYLLTVAVLATAGSMADARILPAQTGGTPSKNQPSPVERWLTEPTPIVLTKAQQPKVESLKKEYVAERDSIGRSRDPGNEQALIMSIMGLDRKYLKAVNAFLDEAQRKVLESNLAARGGMRVPKS